jgi:hypothetical protein
MKTLKSYWYILGLAFLLPVAVYASGENQIAINFSEADISSVHSKTDELYWIRLKEGAQAHLKDLTQESYGADLKIDIEGVTVLKTRIHATIESGVIRVDNPSDDVKNFLKKYIHTRMRKNKNQVSE